jgi:hypothetical protein
MLYSLSFGFGTFSYVYFSLGSFRLGFIALSSAEFVALHGVTWFSLRFRLGYVSLNFGVCCVFLFPTFKTFWVFASLFNRFSIYLTSRKPKHSM